MLKVLRNVGEGRGNLSEERFPLPSPTSLPPKTFVFLGRGGEEAMPERISIFPRKENRPRNGTPAARPACPPYFSNRDSINTKVFGKGGMGFGEGREKLFFRKVFPPFPNLPLLLPHQPRFLKLFLGRERQKASTTRAMVTQNMMAESALTSGFTPSRTIE